MPDSRTEPTAARMQADSCPGALTVHQAADGGLARVRLPGGALSATALLALADAADELADGQLELTSRGNVQVRGLAPGAERELGDRLAEVGLLPSRTHERVRNILASPMSGLDGRGATDVTDLAAELDRRLCERPTLAQLSGRFQFGFDDGRGDVASLRPDVTVQALSADEFVLFPGSVPLSRLNAIEAPLAAAEAFLQKRAAWNSAAWRVTELPDGGAGVAEQLRRRYGPTVVDVPVASPPNEPVGISAQPCGRWSLTVLAPLGRLTSDQARLLGGLPGGRGLRITPWRSVVVCDITEPDGALAAAAGAGLGVAADSPWYRVSACTGRPGCAKALADVRADALADIAEHGTPGVSVRWSGCQRRCGRPQNTAIDLVATEDGYVRTGSGAL